MIHKSAIVRNLFALLLVLLLTRAISYPMSDARRQRTATKYAAYDQARAVRGLLKRLIPKSARQFVIGVNFSLGPRDKDIFQVESKKGKIFVTGNSGYSAAFGIHYYLKHYCDCHVSWSGNQLRLPNVLPLIPSPVKKVSNDRYRYYMNVCTFSYSTVWWDWNRWQREIDWMALNGINLPLAFTGQEAIWKRVFKSFNFTNHDVDEFFTGPAFLAWNRMGNIQGWAGPLSDVWLLRQLKLQHRILRRMRSFGMTTVLPAFSGRVPPSIKRIFPNASVSYLPKKWGNFDPPYGPVAFLEPTDPLFSNFSEAFLHMYITEYGTDHVYNIDLFNEMPPAKNSSEYLTECGKQIYKTLTRADPQAVWLMQGWMFYFDQSFWNENFTRAFLTSVPTGGMIILDLQAELYPQYQRLNSYYGQPFIWCMLQNFGGVEGLYGSLNSINTGTFEGRGFNGSTMIGTGIAPEGIETNDIIYELMNDLSWLPKPVSLSQWVSSYVRRRYGTTSGEIQLAWKFLSRSVYNASVPYRNQGKYVLTHRPSLKLKQYIWYNMTDVFKAWRLFIDASLQVEFNSSQLFRHDLVDVTRQGLQVVTGCLYAQFTKAYRKKDWISFRNISSNILDLYEDVEQLLSSDKHFLLGNWLNSSVSWATTPVERKQYMYNARNQITLWGPTGQILDYASKQWAGIMTKYFRKRWELFIEMLEKSIKTGRPFIQAEYNKEVLDRVESPFTLDDEIGPLEPFGEPTIISANLLKKYEKFFAWCY